MNNPVVIGDEDVKCLLVRAKIVKGGFSFGGKVYKDIPMQIYFVNRTWEFWYTVAEKADVVEATYLIVNNG